MNLADVVMESGRTMAKSGAEHRSRVLNSFKLRDRSFHWITFVAAILVLMILGAVIVSLVVGSIPAFRAFGFGFLLSQSWNPVTDRYGALAPIVGTLVTSVIAMFFAVPVGLGIAIFLTELCPQRFRRPIGIAIELLAGIPSIIYGIWGLFFLAPFLQSLPDDFSSATAGMASIAATYLSPSLLSAIAYAWSGVAAAFTWIGGLPVISTVIFYINVAFSTLFAGPFQGVSTLTAGIILSIMVLPFISSIARDVFNTVPPVLKEAAYGVGCTTSEVLFHVVVPYARAGVIGGIMLALGRALGETMAVTFVIGNAQKISPSLLQAGTTISAKIAFEFGDTDKELYVSSLIALGLILFVITFVVLAVARFMLMRIERRGRV
jgi:phosphate transport system permease protein